MVTFLKFFHDILRAECLYRGKYLKVLELQQIFLSEKVEIILKEQGSAGQAF